MRRLKDIDPLLAIAKAVVWFLIVVLAAGAIGALFAAPTIGIMHAEVTAALVAEGRSITPGIIWALSLSLLGLALLLAAAIWFLLLLKRIIDSVGEGDPFAPINATRLLRMAWIALCGQLAAIPIGSLLKWVAVAVKETHPEVHTDGSIGLSGNGILLILLLFILARVFRHGAAMREDLEGTV